MCKIVRARKEAGLDQMVVVETERSRRIPGALITQDDDLLEIRCKLAVVSKLTSGLRFEEHDKPDSHGQS